MSDVQMFGSVAKVNEYKRKNGIEVTETAKPIETAVKGAFKIGNVNPEEVVITDEEMVILNKVILKSNPEEVYMQEDVDFYDSYYFNKGNSLIDKDLLREARSIRRIYKNYTKYLYACYIRERYLDMIEEVFSSPSDNTVMNLKSIPDDVFIPPSPMYSRNAPDYDKAMAGILTTEIPIEPVPPEELEKMINSYAESRGIDVTNIGTTHEVCVNRVVESVMLERGNSDTKFSGPSVNVTDLDNLQRLIKSWHQKEDEKKKQVRNIPFPESDAGKRYRYLNAYAWHIIDEMEKEEDQEEDENELVHDEKTKHTMTRKEYNQRQMVRFMAREGGWDEIKLMQQLQIGSKIERTKLKNKAARRKKARKKASNFFSEAMGDNSFGDDIITPDELRRYLFND